MKYYIISGEASGDLHGANLMKSLKAQDQKANFRFWGGDLMAQVDDQLVKHYKELAFMGFLEVFLNLKTILNNLSFCKQDILSFKPDALILIDYPGFNLRIARWAKKQGIKTHYYISPQIWAWKESRIKTIKQSVDHMYVILPFEKPFYEQKHDYAVHFVGHPLLDAITQLKKTDESQFRKNQGLSQLPLIAILPGSRVQEVRKLLPTMLSVVDAFPEYQFVIAGAPSLSFDFYRPFLHHKNVGFVHNKTYALLSISHAALVTSGTATLETALFQVPQVVCYKSSWISYEIAKLVVKLKYISLVNLILDKEVIKELIQRECNRNNVKGELNSILFGEKRNICLEGYRVLMKKLGGEGASLKTARLIFKSLT